jgi:endo-1,4-beta-D-glucanase Y
LGVNNWRAWALAALSILISSCRQVTPEERLSAMWEAYRATYVAPEGYAHDPLRSGQVTSEAQSYALLQSAWLRDRATFDRVLRWTDQHLKRPDGLLSWLWDPATGRIIDANSATDAETDIAFALIVAADAFDEPAYRERARDVLAAIRSHASLPIGDGWFPSAGNWAAADRVVNLSYFAPYAYAYFDALDPGQGWDRAIDIGYRLLDATTRGTPARLPPDFVRVSIDGVVSPLPDTSTLSRLFSFDGIRIPWRIEMDCRLRRDPRACVDQPLVGRLRELLRRDGRLVTSYTMDGRAEGTRESLSFYGALLPVLSRTVPDDAREWRSTRLSDRQLSRLRRAKDRYYDANWVWFGFALADNLAVTRSPRIGRSRLTE